MAVPSVRGSRVPSREPRVTRRDESACHRCEREHCPRMTPNRNRRVILAALCVEAVAAAAVVVYGHLAIVAVAVLYWIDLLFLKGRVGVQRLFARPTRGIEIARMLLPFRLLKHKRGTITLTDRLPPVYPKNAPVAAVTLWWGGLISVQTVSVVALTVPIFSSFQ